MAKTLWIVVPCYNEHEVLPVSAPALMDKLNGFIAAGRVSPESHILFVNDGSKDGTWEIICALHEKDARFCGISLAHNAGEQNAYLAGMFTAVKYADVIITTDCDLQDDINAMDEMLDRFDEGNEIVYGVRKRRVHEGVIHRNNAGLFYKLMKLCGTELPEEHSQYRLMSKRAVEMLSQYGEVNMFIPALVPLIGLKNTTVEHERSERAAGKSNYSFKKLVKLSVEAVTSFSSAPLALITLFTVLCAVLFAAGLVGLIAVSVKNGAFSVPWAVLASVWFIAAGLGASVRIIGEYVCKNYTETKKRPRYSIADELL